ncbi:PIPO, partial [Cucumber vein yellowing virus]|uniref:PIPO n=1 Tax=Cucumber vein yellowing virus TaxID=137475 RepID=UPI00026512EB
NKIASRRNYYARAHSSTVRRVIFMAGARINEFLFKADAFVRFMGKTRKGQFKFVFDHFVTNIKTGPRDHDKLGLHSV